MRGQSERIGVSSGSQSAFSLAVWLQWSELQWTSKLRQPWPRIWPNVTGGNFSRVRRAIVRAVTPPAGVGDANATLCVNRAERKPSRVQPGVLSHTDRVAGEQHGRIGVMGRAAIIEINRNQAWLRPPACGCGRRNPAVSNFQF
jgi:hypothetical protein